MVMRERFEKKLNELRDAVLKMGSMVEEELTLALNALEALDLDQANQVYEADREVNAMRFAIEEKSFALIVTQQPAARDLRAIVAVMNMIVDLERMGDQAKGIAGIIPYLEKYPKRSQLPQVKQMGAMVNTMLCQGMTAYANSNVDLARMVATQDDEVDRLYVYIFTQVMEKMAGTKKQEKVEASYEILRASQKLERFGDLATNIAERVIYLVTGELHEINAELGK